MSGGVRALSAGVCLLVRLLPDSLRQPYGEEIRRAVRDRVAEGASQHGIGGALAAALSEAADLARTAVAARRSLASRAPSSAGASQHAFRSRQGALRGLAAAAATVAAVLIARDLPRASDPAYYDELTVNAVDPAGPFSLTLRRGQLVAGTLGGQPLPPERLRQSGQDIQIMHEDGTVLLALRFEPPGLVRWEARSP